MKIALTVTALLLCQAAAAHALQTPEPAVPLANHGDSHVQVAQYDPTQPVLIVSAVGRQVTISFGADESIKMAVLPSGTVVDNKAAVQPWQGPPGDAGGTTALGNILPLWVMAPGRSNAQVITSTASGGKHVYLFELIALPEQPNDCPRDDCDDPRLVSGLSFTYPPERKSPVDLAAAQTRAALQKLNAEARLKTDIFYGVRNYKYDVKGSAKAIKDLAPNKLSDNTAVTGFLYPGNRPLPAVYIVEADGSERPVALAPDKDLLVAYETVPGCPDVLPTCVRWRLRKADEVVDIWNLGPDQVGGNPYTGTISPAVIRITRRAPAAGK